MARKPTRRVTTQLIEWAEQGIIDWETLARDALNYMSESDVKDMAHVGGYFDTEDDDTVEYDDDDSYDREGDFIIGEYR
jgi:hypothetical protein